MQLFVSAHRLHVKCGRERFKPCFCGFLGGCDVVWQSDVDHIFVWLVVSEHPYSTPLIPYVKNKSAFSEFIFGGGRFGALTQHGRQRAGSSLSSYQRPSRRVPALGRSFSSQDCHDLRAPALCLDRGGRESLVAVFVQPVDSYLCGFDWALCPACSSWLFARLAIFEDVVHGLAVLAVSTSNHAIVGVVAAR